MSALAILAATAASLAALACLAATDPKRRRAFGLEAPAKGPPRLAWTAALLPGLLVPFWASAAGFFVWFGAVAVLGWVVVAISPARTASVRRLAANWVLTARRHLDPRIRSAHRRVRQALVSRPADPKLEARVMLVLLIIFMIAVPLATVDVAVDLPSSTAEPAPRPAYPVFLSVRDDLTLALGETVVDRGALGPGLDALVGGDKETRVFLRADQDVPYGERMEVMDLLRAAGYLKIALVGLETVPQGAP